MYPSTQVSNLLDLINVEEKGRTVFLLKAKAKPHGAERKRFRYSLEKPAIVPKIAPKVI